MPHDVYNDPHVAEAKQLLLKALEERQKSITGIRPPDPARKESYAALLKKFQEYRGAPLWYPYIGSGFGKGPLVELEDGSVKYDFISGVGPHILGHNHPLLLDVTVNAALNNTFMQGNLQQNRDSFDLSQLLIEASHLDHCFFSTGGGLANENALKIAFQRRNPASRILAFGRCFLGRTLATTQVTDKPSFREGLPINYAVDYVPYFDPDRPDESTREAVAILKKHLWRYPKQHAIMIFELIQGEGGFHTAPREFFITLMDILKAHHILICDDEVQIFGRTPELFGFHYLGLEEYVDIVCIGKLAQICATLFKKEVAPNPGLLSSTFIGSTVAIKASKAIVEELMQGHYFGKEGKNQKIHNYFQGKLDEIANRHPTLIKGPYGVGSMVAFTPYGGDTKRVTQFTHQLFDAGVMAFIAGENPTRVRMLPPTAVVTTDDIDKVCAILEEGLVKG